MAHRRIKQATLMLTGIVRPELLCYSYSTAQKKLAVAEKYIFQLIKQGDLERIVITDTAGEELGRGVSMDSVHAYMKKQKEPSHAKFRPKRQMGLFAE